MDGVGTTRQRINAYLEALSQIPDYNRAADQELRRLKGQAMGGNVRPSAAGAAADAASSWVRADLGARQPALAVIVLFALILALASAVRLGGGISTTPPVMVPAGIAVQDV